MRVKPLIGRLRVSNKILLLEDDILFAETIVDLLEEERLDVVHVVNGQEALNKTFEEKFDIYIFDINVPLIDGIILLKELREAGDETPAIFLTSHQDKDILKRGFLSGADDYIKKPFDTDELLLRINAIKRRDRKSMVKCIKSLCHDELHKTISYEGRMLELSKKEYELLLLLMQHANKSVPKDLILSEIWDSSKSGSNGVIRVYIARLKRLLPDIVIENIRGIGYKLVS